MPTWLTVPSSLSTFHPFVQRIYHVYVIYPVVTYSRLHYEIHYNATRQCLCHSSHHLGTVLFHITTERKVQ